MIVYNQYYLQFDVYLGCHAILAITNKNIYGYFLWNIDPRRLEGSDMLAKDNEAGERSLCERYPGHRDKVNFVHVAIYQTPPSQIL